MNKYYTFYYSFIAQIMPKFYIKLYNKTDDLNHINIKRYDSRTLEYFDELYGGHYDGFLPKEIYFIEVNHDFNNIIIKDLIDCSSCDFTKNADTLKISLKKNKELYLWLNEFNNRVKKCIDNYDYIICDEIQIPLLNSCKVFPNNYPEKEYFKGYSYIYYIDNNRNINVVENVIDFSQNKYINLKVLPTVTLRDNNYELVLLATELRVEDKIQYPYNFNNKYMCDLIIIY
ncbi:hypothetical protein Catovirus_1_388 [Catovirus CTV1]|uniref:Uncharacterized protein n=1 Tax=Catovirus CTV1 TaxID=1977631 RepID=A0A1V0S9L0_9VIRU|nr:hypothetical protein Catovirus_1_388 [Catovirus CTV1]